MYHQQYKKMIKKEKFFIGDVVKINEKFKIDGQDIGETDNGVIIKTMSDTPSSDGKNINLYFVNFKKKYPFTNTLSGFLKDSTGYCFYENELDLVESKAKLIPKNSKDIISNLYSKNMKSFQEAHLKTINLQRDCLNIESRMSALIRDFESNKKTLSDINNDLNTYKAIKESIEFVDIEDFIALYSKLLKNEKIKKIKERSYNGRDGILVTTKEIISKKANGFDPFSLGSFAFFIPNNATSSDDILITNLNKKCGSSYFHMCVSSFKACFGENGKKYVNSLINSGDVISLIYYILSFLEEPNYTSAYKSMLEFYVAQPYKKAPKEDEYFNRSFYESGDNAFDSDLAREDIEKVKREMKICKKCESKYHSKTYICSYCNHDNNK